MLQAIALSAAAWKVFCLAGAHGVPGLEVHGQQIEADQVRRQHDLRHHLVELHVLHVGQRIVLAVDGAGLEAGVGLGIGHRRRIRADRAAEELPGVARRHPQLDAGHVGRRVDLLLRLEADLAGAEERRPEDLHLELVLGHLLHLRAEVAGEERVAGGWRRGTGRPTSGPTRPESAWRCPAARCCPSRDCRAAARRARCPA